MCQVKKLFTLQTHFIYWLHKRFLVILIFICYYITFVKSDSQTPLSLLAYTNKVYYTNPEKMDPKFHDMNNIYLISSFFPQKTIPSPNYQNLSDLGKSYHI